MGECILIIEDQERHLRAWDFVHCPPMTSHAFVAKEGGPCVILATGNRRDDLERISRRSEAALRYDAGTEVDLTEPERRGSWEVRRHRAGTSCHGLNARSPRGGRAVAFERNATRAAPTPAYRLAAGDPAWPGAREGHLSDQLPW